MTNSVGSNLINIPTSYVYSANQAYSPSVLDTGTSATSFFLPSAQCWYPTQYAQMYAPQYVQIQAQIISNQFFNGNFQAYGQPVYCHASVTPYAVPVYQPLLGRGWGNFADFGSVGCGVGGYSNAHGINPFYHPLALFAHLLPLLQGIMNSVSLVANQSNVGAGVRAPNNNFNYYPNCINNTRSFYPNPLVQPTPSPPRFYGDNCATSLKHSQVKNVSDPLNINQMFASNGSPSSVRPFSKEGGKRVAKYAGVVSTAVNDQGPANPKQADQKTLSGGGIVSKRALSKEQEQELVDEYASLSAFEQEKIKQALSPGYHTKDEYKKDKEKVFAPINDLLLNNPDEFRKLINAVRDENNTVDSKQPAKHGAAVNNLNDINDINEYFD